MVADAAFAAIDVLAILRPMPALLGCFFLIVLWTTDLFATNQIIPFATA